MANISDLMPASWWPVQPFMPPLDRAQPTMWPSGALGWTPAGSSPPPGWPVISADARSDADSSVSDWDRAMRQALAAQRDAASDAGGGGIARYDQMLADAKRAHDFVQWVLGPPSGPQVRPVGDTMLRGGVQPIAGASPNVVATSAAAPWSVVAAPGADDANAPPPGPADQQPDLGAAYGNPNIMRQGARARAIAATRPPPWPGSAPGADDANAPAPAPTDQQPDLGAAYGNPIIERQGARIRAAAATRPPPPPAIADIWPEIGGAAADAFHNINAGLNPFSAEARAALEAPRPATLMDRLAADWEGKKRVGRGLLGIPQLMWAPVTGASRSLGGHGLQWLDENLVRKPAGAIFGEDRARQIHPGGLSYEEAKHLVDQMMLGLAPRAGLPRAPLAPTARGLPAPLIGPGGAASAGLPHVDAATVPLVPADPPDLASAATARHLGFPEKNNSILYDLAWKKLHELDPANPLLDDRPSGVPTIADRKVLNDETWKIREKRGGWVPEENHWFVQEMRPWFKRRGINPDDYTTYMSFEDHRAEGTGVHARPFLLSQRWRDFRAENEKATADEMHQQLYNILQDWLKRGGTP